MGIDGNMAAAATAAADEALPPGDPSFSFFWLKLGLFTLEIELKGAPH